MITLDEAIAHAREEAKEQRQHIGTWDEEYSKRCEECAEQHEQLAEWLEELKVYRDNERVYDQQYDIGYDKGYDKGFYEGYNKAIDDFVNSCMSVKETLYGQQYVDIRYVKEIAQQLKAGGENDV